MMLEYDMTHCPVCDVPPECVIVAIDAHDGGFLYRCPKCLIVGKPSTSIYKARSSWEDIAGFQQAETKVCRKCKKELPVAEFTKGETEFATCATCRKLQLERDRECRKRRKDAASGSARG